MGNRLTRADLCWNGALPERPSEPPLKDSLALLLPLPEFSSEHLSSSDTASLVCVCLVLV